MRCGSKCSTKRENDASRKNNIGGRVMHCDRQWKAYKDIISCGAMYPSSKLKKTNKNLPQIDTVCE